MWAYENTSNWWCIVVLNIHCDFSRKFWVYFLKKKSQAFECFKEFKALVEKELGKPIKILRIDRVGEYMSNEF